MIAAIKSWFKRPVRWQDEIQELHKNLVPFAGEAESLQGELVRCIQNLADECYRNGWMNWDIGDEESTEILSRYLDDPNVFAETERTLIRINLDKIKYAGEKGADEGSFAYGEIRFIAERVVLWCRKNRKLITRDMEETWLD